MVLLRGGAAASAIPLHFPAAMLRRHRRQLLQRTEGPPYRYPSAVCGSWRGRRTHGSAPHAMHGSSRCPRRAFRAPTRSSTSPPYAGVYDYLSHARESRAKLGAEGPAPLMGLQGTPAGRDWPMDWRSSNEMGARKAMKKFRVPGAYKEAWDADQRAWLAAAKANLRSGGRAALLVGDGENRIDALESMAAAAEEVGLRLLASATITSTARLDAQARPATSRAHPALGGALTALLSGGGVARRTG